MTDLKQLSQRIIEKRAGRGFVTDPLKIHLLLTEEVGEIASELKRSWSKNYDGLSRERLAEEISDVFVLLVALANEYDIQIGEAVEKKFFGKDEARDWKTARG